MIGYYVHHQGRGHLHRATSIIAALRHPAVVLSSLPRPRGWTGEWIELDADDHDVDRARDDVTASGALHWAPLLNTGLQARMRAVVDWIARARPAAMVVDLSVEVAVQARLLGVPVVTTVLPGDRRDRAHQLGFELSAAIVAPWMPLHPAMSQGLERHRDRVHHVGGISRFDGRPAPAACPDARRTVLRLGGTGGVELPAEPPGGSGWQWTERSARRWVDDPWPELCAAGVVVTHCGLGAVADTAAAGARAVFLPSARPHGEQAGTAAGLAEAGLGVVLDAEPDSAQWPQLLDRATELDPARWSLWRTGHGADHAADIICRTAGTPR